MMKKVTIFVALVLLSFGFSSQKACAKEVPLDETLQLLYKSAVPPPCDTKQAAEFTDEELNQAEYALSAVDDIIVHVGDRFLEVMQDVGEGTMVKTYPAGTATKGKNTEALPFEEEGWTIASIALNPDYRPTKDTRDEYFKEHHKKMKKYFPPGGDNPLGKVKFYFSRKGIPSALGLHDTDKQKSVGKRTSHGCVRMRNPDAMTLAKLILTQSGYDAEKFLRQAKKNPRKKIPIEIINGPRVYFERD